MFDSYLSDNIILSHIWLVVHKTHLAAFRFWPTWWLLSKSCEVNSLGLHKYQYLTIKHFNRIVHHLICNVLIVINEVQGFGDAVNVYHLNI